MLLAAKYHLIPLQAASASTASTSNTLPPAMPQPQYHVGGGVSEQTLNMHTVAKSFALT